MPVSVVELVGTGLLFLFTFATGVWVSRSGKPANTLTLTIHKLIALAAAILIGVMLNRLRLAIGFGPLGIAATIVTALLFVLTVASGGWLSTGKPAGAAIQISHKVLPVLTVISSFAAIYLLAGGN